MNYPKNLIFWLPRVLCILAIAFISIFALDAFRSHLTFWQQLRNFIIHMIPSFILIAILVIAWKREITGGIIFVTLGLILSPLVFIHNYRMNDSIGMSLLIIAVITIPLIVVGLLFIFGGRIKKHKAFSGS